MRKQDSEVIDVGDSTIDTMDTTTDPALTWLVGARRVVEEQLGRFMSTFDAVDLYNRPNETFNLIWPWRRLDADGPRTWLRRQVESHWDLVDVIGRFIPVGWISGGEGSRAILGELELGAVDEFFGLDEVFATIAAQLDSAAATQSRDLEPNPENRRRSALSSLSVERQRRLGIAPATASAGAADD